MAIRKTYKPKEIIETFLASVDVKPVSREEYRRKIGYFFAFFLKQGVNAPDHKDIVAYKDKLEKDGYKAATIQAYLQPVKMFFKWIAKKHNGKDISAEIKNVKIGKTGHKKDFLTAEQVKAVLDGIDQSAASGKRDYAILSLMAVTGIREISVILANVEDIRTSTDGRVLLYQGKGRTEKDNYVKLPQPVMEAIDGYLQSRGKVGNRDPLFVSEARRNGGGRLTTRSISRIVKNRFLAVGIDSDRLTGHSLRHTAAALNLLGGGSMEETRQLLGHANISTTAIYTHDLERFANKSEDRISRTIFDR